MCLSGALSTLCRPCRAVRSHFMGSTSEAMHVPVWCTECFVPTPQSCVLPFHGRHERGRARRSGGGHTRLAPARGQQCPVNSGP